MSTGIQKITATNRLHIIDQGSQEVGTEGSYKNDYNIIALDTTNLEVHQHPVKQIVSYPSTQRSAVTKDSDWLAPSHPDSLADVNKERQVIARITTSLGAIDPTPDADRSQRGERTILTT